MNLFSRNFLSRLKKRFTRWRISAHDRQITAVIEQFSESNENVYLVQIGANDGRTNDPFYDYIIAKNWEALLVEPVPYVFERLQKTHLLTPGIILENAAISDRQETKPFYFLRKTESENAPWWYDQIGSFSREQVMKSKGDIPELESLLTSTPVRCLSLAQLLESHFVREIDILHTDLEGFDFSVLQQVDFERFAPRLILYEHKHLLPPDQADCFSMIKAHGYRLIVGSADTLAVRIAQ